MYCEISNISPTCEGIIEHIATFIIKVTNNTLPNYILDRIVETSPKFLS